MAHLKILIILFFTVIGLHAAALKGTVLNPENLPIPDAEIRVLNTLYSDITDSCGNFNIEDIPPGTYDIVFQHISYQSRVLSGIRLISGPDIDLGTIRMKFGIFDSQNVIVTATRTEHQPFDLAQSVSVIPSSKIIERSAKSAAEALREEPAVFVQKTNHGGGSAILRGMSSSQILLMVDGIRLNNSIYRLGNHQYLTTVDYNMLDQIEILRGPGSLQYGSDALGGTINLKTHTPSLSANAPFFKFGAFGRYATADQERTLRPELSYHGNRLAVKIGWTIKKLDDLRRGSRSFHKEIERSKDLVQSPSGFSASDLDFKLQYALSKNRRLIWAYQKSVQERVPRYDKYENDGYHQWLYEPQDRDLVYLTYREHHIHHFLSTFKLNLSYQLQSEGRIIQPDPDATITREKDDVGTIGLSTQFDTPLSRQLITYGFEVYRDQVNSRRRLENPISENINEAPRGRYPDDARYMQSGIFVQDEIFMSRNWRITPGMRFSYHTTRFDLKGDTLTNPPVERVDLDFSSLTGSIGVLYRISDQMNISLMYSQGFRAPNLSDLSKLGESKSNVYEIPNPDLKPEKSHNIDLGIKIRTDDNEAAMTLYYARLTDLLASADDRYNGRESLVINGQTYKIKSKQNIGKGFVIGLEHYFRSRLSKWVSLRGQLTYTYGQNTSLNEPIGGIPPLFGLIGLKYIHPRFNLDYYLRFATRQRRLSDDDKDDKRIPEGGTPGWYTLNFRTKVSLFQRLNLYLALENILDMNYREHGSGINAPGRNFIISLEFKP